MSTKDSLVNLFLELVAVPSPSGKELAVATFIREYLQAHDIEVEVDSAENDSDTGNLIARLPGDTSMPTLLFVAHMDTVETGERPVSPIVKGDIITSDGTTILGADDKGPVACLMELLVEVSRYEHHPSIVVAFTTREERGQMGSSLLAIPDDVDYAFNIDGAGRLGDFAYRMLGVTDFVLTINGKAAHAANNPEDGANALMAAARIISALPIGKSDDGVVLNIGSISGGTANNIVPDKVVLGGAVRAYSKEEIDAVLGEVTTLASEQSARVGCTYSMAFDKHPVPPSSQTTDHPIVDMAKRAAVHADVPFRLTELSATSDANYLGLKYPTLTVCRGSAHPHGFDESITVANLHGIKRLLLSIIAASARQ